MAQSQYQKYETRTINRQEIKNAPYNPRIMDADAEKRLRAEIKKNGLVAAPTWNQRTGNLVGGHQRLKQLDALEKTKDYDLTVCVIDVDERQEAILNVELNNPSIQGDWDIDKLADLARDLDIDLTVDTSFTDLDIDFMFSGDSRFSDMFESDEAGETKGILGEIKQARSDANKSMADRNNINFYVTIVFQDEDARARFMHDINLPVYEQFITEEQVRRLTEE